MTEATSSSPVVASVIIPAHDEETVIADLLDGLIDDEPRRFEIVVVCNGCTDRTADVARAFGTDVAVVEIAEPSKRLALARGDEVARHYPRLYIDADVQIDAISIDALIGALSDRELLAVAPARRIPMDHSARLVRWYYDVWAALPQVRSGLFGRGVIALSEAGNTRVRSLPAVMGDDLVASEAFDPSERAIVDGAQVVVWPPRTMADLIRRRTRAMTGNDEADRAGLRRRESATSWGSLGNVMRSTPGLIPKVPVFVGVAAIAKWRARRAIRAGDTATWLRDNSSRRRGDA